MKLENGVEIIGNHHHREAVYGYELTEKEAVEFDYIPAESFDTNQFIRYKGEVIDLYDLCPTNGSPWAAGIPSWLRQYDGYISDSFFSGILVKWIDDEHLQIYTYIS
jgi:hypothetical protein